MGQADGRQGTGKGKLDKMESKRGQKENKAGDDNQANQSTDGAVKTKICRFFLQGACQKGSSCTFLHSLAGSQSMPACGSEGQGKAKSQGCKSQAVTSDVGMKK